MAEKTHTLTARALLPRNLSKKLFSLPEIKMGNSRKY